MTPLLSSDSGKSKKKKELIQPMSGKIVFITLKLGKKVNNMNITVIEIIKPKTAGIKRYYFVCCRDGNYRGHKLSAVSQKECPHQKSSRKMNGTCISRMYVDLHESKRVTVRYIPTHTGHKPGYIELKFLPLPESTKDEVTLKLAQGIPSKRILQGTLSILVIIHNIINIQLI